MKNMNPVKLAIAAVVALFLFMGSFILFAALSGTPLHELAVVGSFFPAPPEEQPEDEPLDVVEEVEQDQRSEELVLEAAAVPLHSFLLQSPFSTEELDQLQRTLKDRIESNEALRRELLMRSADLDVREEHLENRWRELEQIRGALTNRELELSQRDQELVRDEEAQAQRDRSSWAGMASLFADGEVEVLIERLLTIPEDKAALILRALPDDRAGELLQALEGDDFRTYMNAYREAGV